MNGEGVRYRPFLLAMVLAGAVGLLVELLLLEHYDSPWQFTPLALLAATLLVAVQVAVRPGRSALLIFRAVMALCVAAGALGMYLHYAGNMEFELERHPELGGLPLFWESIRGATPALASAALSQLGLLGLAFAYRHPALQRDSG